MYQTILFDVDGTLINSEQGIINALDYMSAQMHWAPIAEQDYYRFIGPALSESIPRYYHIDDQVVVLTAIKHFQDYYNERGIFECEVYPGITTMLQTLHAAGRHLAIATAKPEVMAQRLLAHFALDQYLDGIYGATLDETIRSRKVQIITYALDEMHLQNHLADVMMVGDRRDDVAGARDNHIDAMGVTYGFGTARELKDAGARVIATSPADVADWLLRH